MHAVILRACRARAVGTTVVVAARSTAPSAVALGLVGCAIGPAPPSTRTDAEEPAAVRTRALAPEAVVAEPSPPLPDPRTNVAVASTRQGSFAALGLGPGRTSADVRADAYWSSHATGRWERVGPVPDSPGRLAGAAWAVGERVFLLGGYTVAADGAEVSLPRVDVWDATGHSWSRAAPMPVPVDDAVVVGWRDRWILTVSGWSNDANVDAVQIYDTQSDAWSSLTAFPGTPVFGHAGAIAGDVLVTCGGAAPRRPEAAAGTPKYTIVRECWRGELTAGDSVSLRWSELESHPGPARYRAAAGALDGKLVWAGGTDNPYNYDGIGYDGVPARPLAELLVFEPASETWSSGGELPEPVMDLRALAPVGDALLLVGGMREGQRVSPQTWRLAFDHRAN